MLKFTSYFAGMDKNFNQWDPLIDGQDENLIQGTNVTVLQSAIWTASRAAEDAWDRLAVRWGIHLAHGTQWNGPKTSRQAYSPFQDYILEQ